MNSIFYGPIEPHLWLVGKIPPKTRENCRETSEENSRVHPYDKLTDLLIKLALAWTSICVNFCEGKSLPKGIQDGYLPYLTPIMVRAADANAIEPCLNSQKGS